MALSVNRRWLSYSDALKSRNPADIDLLVIHCTELPDLEMAREYGERIHYADSGTGNSGHYYIDRDGSTEQWVPEDRVAHHVRGYNERSIGVELVNTGRYPDWLQSDRQAMNEPYPESQIEALSALIESLAFRYPGLQFITGHENLDTEQVPASDDPGLLVRRKCDPGPLFPWVDVLSGCELTWLEPDQQISV